MEPRELVLRELRESPWLQQRELAARLSEETGMAESTLIRLFRRMEADGELQSGLDGRRKTYALAEPVAEAAPEPTPGALWSRRLEALGEPEPEPEEEPEPEPRPVEAERESAPPPAPPAYTRPAWPFAAVVAAVIAFAVIAAIVLSPSKNDPLTGAEQQQQETRPAGR